MPHNFTAASPERGKSLSFGSYIRAVVIMTHRFQIIFSVRPKSNEPGAAPPADPLGRFKRFVAGLVLAALAVAILVVTLFLGWLMLAFLAVVSAFVIIAVILKATIRRRSK